MILNSSCAITLTFELRKVLTPSHESNIIVIYWPSTEPLIKICTCVNKRKNSRSRWSWDNNITRCPGRFELVGVKMPKWKPATDRGLWALSNPRLSNPSQDEEEVMIWSEELGSIKQSVPVSSSSLTHQKHNPFENKVWEIYFYKEVYSFVHWSSYIIFDYVSVLRLYNSITAVLLLDGLGIE